MMTRIKYSALFSGLLLLGGELFWVMPRIIVLVVMDLFIILSLVLPSSFRPHSEKDSTGIPHILEHSVLCGSRKYLLKGPFVALLKGSLHTFLNAFTYPDRTCYPVASTNTKDFYNLVDVYLDAVFFPKCVEDIKTFQQEGWHYELNEPSDDIIKVSVVFNEMKGVYSQPDSILGRASQQALCPDNTYGVDCGGDPQVIPKLTFEELKEFHRKYYHPSNARIWFYGDDDPSERLHILSEYLGNFEANSAPGESRVNYQKLFSEPVRIVEKYPAAGGGNLKKKHMVCLNWLLSETPLDLETELALVFLNHLMMGTPASPMRKILLESHLGDAIVGGGVEDEVLQSQFSAGLKGVSEDDIKKVEELVVNNYLEFLEALEKKVDDDWPEISSSLEEIRRILVTKNDCLVNLTANGKNLANAEKYVSRFLDMLPNTSAVGSTAWSARLPSTNEAIVIPTQVNYVGKAANLFDTGYQLEGSAYVISKYLSNTWLWDRVKVGGGAYGGFCVFSFLSYRDPNLLKTLDIYDGTSNFLRELQMDDDALTKAIIGTIGDVDAYQLPDAKGYSSLLRYLLGVTEEERQIRREENLSTRLIDFREFADVIEAVKNKGVVVAVASPEDVNAANETRPNFFEVKKAL
ncbi:hypothetical protein OROGR_009963 [Orobanche gracilis]